MPIAQGSLSLSSSSSLSSPPNLVRSVKLKVESYCTSLTFGELSVTYLMFTSLASSLNGLIATLSVSMLTKSVLSSCSFMHRASASREPVKRFIDKSSIVICLPIHSLLFFSITYSAIGDMKIATKSSRANITPRIIAVIFKPFFTPFFILIILIISYFCSRTDRTQK